MNDKNVPAIKISGLSKSFGELEVLKNLSIEIKQGEIVSIIGGSGCGKSVFLRLIEMLEIPDAGKIFINGEEITAKGADIDRIRRGMGMVYQNFYLFSHLNVLENMTLAPRKILGMEKDEAAKKALDLLDMVGLASKADAMPSALSGGQKQRIAIVRALMMDPKILLFDEPTSALDPAMVGEVLATMRMLSKRGLTMIIVTHEFKFAKDVSTRVLYFAEKGIYDQGTPREIFDEPKKKLTIDFIRKIKNITEHIDSADFDLMNLHGRIYLFGEKYGFTQKQSYRLQLCVEELLYEYIKAAYPDWKRGDSGNYPVDIDLSVEFAELDDTIMIEIWAGGDEKNIFDNDTDEDLDHIGIVIVKKIASNYSWEYSDRRNHVFIEMKSKNMEVLK